MQKIEDLPAADMRSERTDWRLLSLAGAVFLGYLTVALPLPVIPLYVHDTLGFGDFLVGVSVGIQFLATILTRGHAGKLSDQSGSRRAVRSGLGFCALAGAVYILSAVLPLPPAGRLAVLIAGRLVLGFGESQMIVGILAWGIGTVGQPRAGRVLAWTGMAMYGSLAAGAPIGLWLDGLGGFVAIGAATMLCPLLALALTWRVPPVAPLGGQRASFWRVIGRIWRPGLGVALQGVGFAAIGAFVALHFAARGWPHGALALTCFGAGFVLVRIVGGGFPDRFGGVPVAIVSLAVEALGQGILWLADDPVLAFAGAGITGLGCSLVYPSFGVEVVKRVPPQIRGTALGGFAAFQDFSYGATGPVTGLVAGSFGYPWVFAIGMVAALLGLGMAVLTGRERP